MKKNPEYLPSPEAYVKHLVTYCKYLDYMEGMFNAGKEKKHVLDGVINLHRPASYWQEQQAKAKAAAQVPPTSSNATPAVSSSPQVELSGSTPA